MRRWFAPGLVLVGLTACHVAAPADDVVPATVQYRVEGPAVSLHVPDLLNPTPFAEVGDYWLVREDPITIHIAFPFRPTRADREQLETRIRQWLSTAKIHDLTWDGNQVHIHLDLPPGTHGLAFGNMEGLTHNGLDRALWLERTRPYQVMAWQPGGQPAAAARLNLPVAAEGVGLVVSHRDFLIAGGELQGPVDMLRTIWSWTPGGAEAAVLPGAFPVNIARWTGEDQLWVRHEVGLVVDTGTGTVEREGVVDVAVHPDGRTAHFQVRLTVNETWPRTWHWRLVVLSSGGEPIAEWDLFNGESLESVVPWLNAWWGPGGIVFTPYTVDADTVTWWLAVVDPDAGNVRTLAGPAQSITPLGEGQYLLVDADSGEWRLWKPETELTGVTLPPALQRRVMRPHSLWGEWMVLYTHPETNSHGDELVIWRVNAEEWLGLGPVKPLGWHEGTFYWLHE